MARRSFWLALTTVAVLPSMVAAQYPTSAGYSEGTDLVLERSLARGVTHRFEAKAEGPLTINTLEFDPKDPRLRLESEKGHAKMGGREPVGAMMERIATEDLRPIAGINGDFYGGGGEPVHMFVDEGTIWRGPWTQRSEEGTKTRPVVAVDAAGNSFVGTPRFTANLRGGAGEVLLIDKINFHDNASLATAYTWAKGERTAAIRENQSQIVLELATPEWLPNSPATVTVKTVDQGPDAALTKTTVVIHADNPIPNWIAADAKLTLDARFEGLPGKVTAVMGGLPRLIDNGVKDPKRFGAEDAAGATFVTDLHPRTGVGRKPDGTLVFVTVDGRQPRRSRGIDLIDFADYFESIGCTDAVNLDGGGSTTMVTRGEVVNFPSDPGGSRSVSNALILSRTGPRGPLAKIAVLPPGAIVPVGSIVTFKVEGYDAEGEQVPLTAMPRIEYREGKSTTPFTESVSFTKAGTGTVVATMPGEKPIMAVTTVQAMVPATVRLHPRTLLLDRGAAKQVSFELTGKAGERFHPNFAPADVTIPDCVAFDAETRTVTAKGTGSGVIKFMFGEVVAELPVAAETYATSIADSFEAAPTLPLELLRANDAKTTLTLDASRSRDGAASWKLDYAMRPGGVTKIGVNMAVELPGDPIEVGLWVYGDGNAQWLRGDLKDSRNLTYKMDFTDSANGIDWKDEWKFLRASIQDAGSLGGGVPPPTPPYRLVSVYIAQPQEAAKRDGTIWIDAATAIALPAGAP